MSDDHSPPTSYNHSPRAFRPGQPYGRTTGGLNERVNGLHSQGRFRSAMDEIFKVLDGDPDNQQALELAWIVAGGIRTTHIQTLEPLTPAYLLDRRLDPIATICSRCARSWVGGDHLLIMHGSGALGFLSFNSGAPRPMQCYRCGYVLCSECLTEMTVDDPLGPGVVPNDCPICGSDQLRRPAYPTGRPPQQMKRHLDPVVQMIVFREGPVPPDETYLRNFIEPVSPDAIRDHARLVGIPVFPWPSHMETVARNTLIEKEASGDIPAGSVTGAEVAGFTDERGNRLYIAKILKPSGKPSPGSGSPTEKPKGFLARWLSSSRTKPETPSPQDRTAEDLMRRHLARVVESATVQPHPAVSVCRALASPAILEWIRNSIAMNRSKSLAGDREYTDSTQIDGLCLLVTTVPKVFPEQARAYFPHGYIVFVDAQIQQAGFRIGAADIAHWIYCHDGDEAGVHLTLFLTKGTPVVPLDLLTQKERSMIGM